jgi:hypothetical protein
MGDAVAEAIVRIAGSEVREGKLERLKMAISELAEFIAANEPQLIANNFYFNEDGTRMTVAVHPDSASMEFPMIARFRTT